MKMSLSEKDCFSGVGIFGEKDIQKLKKKLYVMLCYLIL